MTTHSGRGKQHRSGTTAYDRLLAAVRPPLPGTASGVHRINLCPEDMDELPSHFAGLEAGELAHVWVAAVALASMRQHTVGDLARALTVVNWRLFGGLEPVPPVEARKPMKATHRPCGCGVRGSHRRECPLRARKETPST